MKMHHQLEKPEEIQSTPEMRQIHEGDKLKQEKDDDVGELIKECIEQIRNV
jgi:hypothetical protein